jgi:hypothetical protein
MEISQIKAIPVVMLSVMMVQAYAATISFDGVNLSSVSSASGQDFVYTVGAGLEGGTLNVRLLSGAVSSVTTGSSPDPTGFYVLQTSSDLQPMIFRFTFDAIRNCTISQNETQNAIELNSFTISEGSWRLLDAVNTNATYSGSRIMFEAENNGPPYGDYAIAGTGRFFDVEIRNLTGFSDYGSAISVNVVPEPGSPILAVLGIAIVCSRRRALRMAERS